MRKELKNLYKKLTKKEQTDKYHILAYNLLFILLIIFVSILPFIFNHTFVSAYTSITISVIVTTILFYIAIQNAYSLNKIGKIAIWAMKGLLTLNILFYLMLLYPVFNATRTPSGALKENTTYITYDEKCPYCEKSKVNMNRAIIVYNQTHKNKVKLIDLNSKKPISSEVKQYIKYKGSIIRKNEDGTFKTKVYTKGDNNGPVAASNSEIYDLIKNISR